MKAVLLLFLLLFGFDSMAESADWWAASMTNLSVKICTEYNLIDASAGWEYVASTDKIIRVCSNLLRLSDFAKKENVVKLFGHPDVDERVPSKSARIENEKTLIIYYFCRKNLSIANNFDKKLTLMFSLRGDLISISYISSSGVLFYKSPKR